MQASTTMRNNVRRLEGKKNDVSQSQTKYLPTLRAISKDKKFIFMTKSAPSDEKISTFYRLNVLRHGLKPGALIFPWSLTIKGDALQAGQERIITLCNVRTR